MVMHSNRTLEIGTGLFVLLGFVALFFLTTQLPASGLKLGAVKKGYHVTADFDNIGDLKVGSPVTMADVSVGDKQGSGSQNQEEPKNCPLRSGARARYC